MKTQIERANYHYLIPAVTPPESHPDGSSICPDCYDRTRQDELPCLPPELLERIARLALEAEGGDVRTWARLSLVSTAWRHTLRGECGRQ